VTARTVVTAAIPVAPAALRRWLPLWALMSVCLPGAVFAGPGDGAPMPMPDDARAWLQRIHSAANTGNYRGTMVFSSGGSISSSRVWHFSVGDQTYEKIEALDGRQQTVVRHNDDVHTLWPQSRLAVIEKREAVVGLQATPQAVDPRALDQYRFRREPDSRVAGREAVVFVLEPRDELRFAQRLWADQASGLLLRADVLASVANAGAALQVIESTSFSEVEVAIKPQVRAVADTVRTLDGYRLVRPSHQRTRLDDEGWTLARNVAGFQLIGCLKRPVPTGADDSRGDDGKRALQAVFTDGLAHVSVFIEPFDLARHKREVVLANGAMHTLTLRRQEYWITAVGDAPPAALKALVASIERKR
jgi:sigma-E factor negative regulatory protein RseB